MPTIDELRQKIQEYQAVSKEHLSAKLIWLARNQPPSLTYRCPRCGSLKHVYTSWEGIASEIEIGHDPSQPIEQVCVTCASSS